MIPALEPMRERLRKPMRQVQQHLPTDRNLLVHSGSQRSRHLNRQLAWPLAFVAGAINAGGFLAIGLYTSHVTGSLSMALDEAALGRLAGSVRALLPVLAFFAGAFISATVIHLGLRRRFRSPYGIALFLEALLLLAFGYAAKNHPLDAMAQRLLIAAALSFFMGMLNAIVTIISAAEVRVTHMTGIVTDLGVELAKLAYWNRRSRAKSAFIMADRHRLRLHAGVLALFCGGGVVGGLGFIHIGYETVFPLAILLLLISVRPVWHDAQIRWRLGWS